MSPGESLGWFSGIAPIEDDLLGAIQSYRWTATIDGGKPIGSRNGRGLHSRGFDRESGQSNGRCLPVGGITRCGWGVN